MAIKTNLVLETGTDLIKPFWWLDTNKTPIDLTGYTGIAEFRHTVEDDVVQMSLTTGNGGIVITPAQGKVELVISYTNIAAIVEPEGVFSVLIISPAAKGKLLAEGRYSVRVGATRRV